MLVASADHLFRRNRVAQCSRYLCTLFFVIQPIDNNTIPVNACSEGVSLLGRGRWKLVRGWLGSESLGLELKHKFPLPTLLAIR